MSSYPSKDQMLMQGSQLIADFCQANSIPPTTLHVEYSKDWSWSACAWYRPTRGIVIHVPSCACVGTGGMAWSYPGYFIDRTPYGVLAHELGHHVDWIMGDERDPRKYSSEFGSRMRKDSGEEKLTNYCPNDAEWFAEMFRLFCTNSDLLKHIRPKTYKLMTAHLTPVVTEPWYKVLADAPARNREQCLKRGAILEDDFWS